jgi:AI-2 transport protein TqsA
MTGATGPGADRPDSASVVPRWVQGSSDLFAMLVTAVLVGIFLVLIGWFSPVLAPLGLGLFLAALAAPLFTWLADRGRSAAVALAITIAVLVLLVGGIAVLALVSARTLTDSLADYSALLDARYPDAGELASLRDVVPPDVFVNLLRSVIDIIANVGGSLVFATVIAALLLLDGRRLSGLVANGLGSRNPVFREAPELAQAAITYFVVRIRVNLVTAAGLLVLMLVVGVDHALLWAVGAFVLSFVPYLGLILALVPPTILAFAESGLVAAAVVVIGGTILNLFAENVLEPTMTGRALSLATWLVFTMFFVWVWLMGPIGALLSMPITVLIVLVLRHNERTRWLAHLLARDEAGATPQERYDRHEPMEVGDAHSE